MSLKYAATKVGSNHWVLPKVGAMKVEAHAYLSDALYEASDEALWSQIANGASYPGVVGAYLMPDTHVGYGIPVGAVIVTEDVIIQAGSGYDISCGVLYMRVPGLTAERVKGKYERGRFIREVEKRVATGVGSGRPQHMPRFDSKKAHQIVRHGAQALGVRAELCERPFIPVPEDLDVEAHPLAWSKVQKQLGSVGGGNHFIEMQVDRDDGSVWVMIHCGSRGFGWQIANEFFYEGARLRGLPSNRREDSWLRADEALGKEYWALHNAAANFAIANRHIIVRGIQEALQEVFACDGEVYFEISHNLVQEETLVLPDGTCKRGFVHRKGATRAFPAGHPDLEGTPWATTGHPCLIPGSMYAGAAILFPEAGAHATACSVNHGSGRVLARGEAKRKLEKKQDAIDEEMRTVKRSFAGVEIEGIVGNTRKTPLDECGHVYKDHDAVLEVLEAEGIARVARRLFPVANMKGGCPVGC
jgi:tRNA-splicing ligase RtcB